MLKYNQFSIYISIITLFVLLLSLVGFTIIGINYVVLNKILSANARSSIELTSKLIKHSIDNYLLPFNRDLMQIQYLITHKVIDDGDEFTASILKMIHQNPEIAAIYYGTVNGDSYGIDRLTAGIVATNIIMNSTKPLHKIRYEYDEQGNFLKKTNLTINYDPRNRPWYQQAVAVDKLTWSTIYNLQPFTTKTAAIPGISATLPIYDQNKQLLGVLGMDLKVDTIQHFINQLPVTNNSMIYITNEKRQVIAYRNPNDQKDIRGKILTPENLKLFQIPLPLSQFQWSEKHTPIILYEYNKQRFFLVSEPIFIKGNSEELWHIIIIVPENDVLALLRSLSLKTLLLAIVILLLGVLVVRYFSQKISRPIIHLAREAQEITRLNLKPKPLLKTMIKEISYMDKSLSNLRTSLNSFQRYVPRSLVKKLLRTGKIAEVGGEHQTITILFSDIKDFTKIAETISPKQLMVHLSEYFQLMTEAVISHQGTLDKYIGDAIMALWNTPTPDKKHALHACRTAVHMMEKAAELNIKNQKLKLPEFIIRISINTGDAIVGNVGSGDRLNFTALGDAVNLASRLEAMNKIYHTQIIVSQSTFEQVKQYFSFRFLDKVAVRGKQESTTIYELITAQDLKNLKKHKQGFTDAFYYYQKGDWHKSYELFTHVTPAYPGDQLANLYKKRCQKLIKKPPQTWDGIWRVDV
ncbi:guanylate cyclase [Legionella beliardensis]|uniref:Guanylate cyclase n=1 Tax=Legionella beliardensis TaxID=91822 RepID=A0A378I4N6_9GAMM|nr:adenylate/guanylate cyclase domain-containing protein [Legionella beliardensis]STX29675.1 guanylate cyclase [Legionella beliardensis]